MATACSSSPSPLRHSRLIESSRSANSSEFEFEILRHFQFSRNPSATLSDRREGMPRLLRETRSRKKKKTPESRIELKGKKNSSRQNWTTTFRKRKRPTGLLHGGTYPGLGKGLKRIGGHFYMHFPFDLHRRLLLHQPVKGESSFSLVTEATAITEITLTQTSWRLNPPHSKWPRNPPPASLPPHRPFINFPDVIFLCVCVCCISFICRREKFPPLLFFFSIFQFHYSINGLCTGALPQSKVSPKGHGISL